MSLRILCYALSLITLLLTMIGLGILEPDAGRSRANPAVVSAAPPAGSRDNADNRSDNADNGRDNRDNGSGGSGAQAGRSGSSDNGRDNSDNGSDNAASGRGSAAADNGRGTTSGGNTAGRNTTTGRNTAGAGGNTTGTGGNTTGGADNDDDNFEFEFDIDADNDGGGNDGIEAFDLGLPPLPPPDEAGMLNRVSVCAPAGQETAILGPDGRTTVWVPPSLPQSVRITLRSLSITSPSIPPTRGLRMGGLIVGLDAEGCEGGALAALPAEVSLEIRYTDADVSAFDEQRLVLALLDPLDQQWKPVPNQVTDPAGNSISAPITTTGIYTVYQSLSW